MLRRDEGAPVVALAKGKVVALGPMGAEGLVLELETTAGEKLRYAHLDRIVGELGIGTEVAQGQLIALLGRSGKAPGPRLRLEFRDAKGALVDPLRIYDRGPGRAERSGEALTGDMLRAFQRDLRPWRAAMRQAGS